MRNNTYSTHRHTARFAAIFGLLALLLGGLALARVLPAAAQGGAAPAAASRQVYLPLIGRGEATLETESEEEGLGFSVALSPAPQIQVGNLLRATITAHNGNSTALSNSVVTLRYDHFQLAYERSEGDRILVIGQGGDTTQVLFRSIGPGETVTGTLLFRVRQGVAEGAVISVRPEFFCSTGLCLGNLAQVQVSSSQIGTFGAAATGDLLVAPSSGGADTVFRFSSNRYNRLDVIKVWLYSRDGSTSTLLPQQYRVGDDGWVRFELRGSDIGQGAWNVLTYATISNAVATAQVTVGASAQGASVAPEPAPATAVEQGVAGAQVDATAEASPAVTAQAGEGGIAGKVTDAATGAGVPDVLVVVSQDDLPLASARTRDDGAYLIPVGLATGSYTVRALAASAGGALAYQDATFPQPVAVTAPQLTAGINFALVRGGNVAGRVTASDTRLGLGGVAVEVRGGAGVVGSGVTGEDGSYKVEGLPQGTYVVSFTTATGDDGDITSYAGGSVAGVEVPAGVTVYVDQALALQSDTASLRGRVTGPGGGLANVLVAVLDADRNLVDLTLSDADGRYATGALENGVYRLAFVTFLADDATTRRHVGAFYGGASYAAATPVTVSGPGVQANLNVALALGGAVSGTVRGAANAALADVLVAAFDANGRVGAVARTSAAGAYELPGLAAGSYKVGFFAEYARSATVRRYQDSYYNGKASLAAADAVTVSQGQTTSGIDAALAQGGAIAGVVTAEGGGGLEGVVVIAQDNAGAIAAVALTDAKGAYRTPGLAPGAYTLLFDTILAPVEASRAYLDEYYDNRQSPPYTTVTAVAGTEAKADATLTRGGQIAGRVSAADTKLGLRGVAVLIYSGTSLVGFTMTDEGGSYISSGLPTGSYTVKFDPSLAADVTTQLYTPQTLAAPVAVTASAVTQGVNVTLSQP